MMWRALWIALLIQGALASTLQNDAEEIIESDIEYFEELDEELDKPQIGSEDTHEEDDVEHDLQAMSAKPIDVNAENGRPGVIDVMNHVHSVPIEEEEAMVGGYIFDVDDNNRNPQQRCYVRNQGTDKAKMPDNIENSIVDAGGQINDDGTNRAQWAKCLPPPMYTLLSIESFAEGDIYNGRYEKRMRNATDFYATLKWLHNEACSHISVRLEDEVMLKKIQEEVNFRERVGTGFRIKQALDPLIKLIVEQYHSTKAEINPANAKTFKLIKDAIGPLKQALRIARHSSMVTLENGEGRRRNQCSKSAKEMLDPLYNNVMKFDINEVDTFLHTRPGPLEDMMTGDGKRGLGNPVVGSDGLPDSLKNYGKCGKPLFDYAGYVLYTFTVSQNKNDQITFLTKDGWKTPEQIVQMAQGVPLRQILPPDAYEVETKTTSYQDDMFASGNLACNYRKDGLWTLTSYDRNSQDNKVTATQEEGYFCVWMLNDLLVLPENQRAGFSNTEFIAKSPQEMARVMNGDVENYKRYFPKPGESYKYYHCHYSPRNSGAARVHSFQHQAERHYPGGIRQYCNCDWRRMGMIVSRCDCTLDAKANGGCRRVEMEMLNEHTQHDLWRKDGNKNVPSQVAIVHGDLAEGKIKSYTYNNNRRRRNPDNKNIYQASTGRVRATTNGNGGNNVVCSVQSNTGVPQGNFQKVARPGNNKFTASGYPPKTSNCQAGAKGWNQDIFYNYNDANLINGNTDRLSTRRPSQSSLVSGFHRPSTSSTWSGFSSQANFAVRWSGIVKRPTTQRLYLELISDDGSVLYINNDRIINNDGRHTRRSSWGQKTLNAGEAYRFRVVYFQYNSAAEIQFNIKDYTSRADLAPVTDQRSIVERSCTEEQPVQRSFFADMNDDGKADYAECRRRRTNNSWRRRRGPVEPECTEKGKEFAIRDIQSRTDTVPAGGINYEFIGPDGKACDVLNMKESCKPADAGDNHEGSLVNFLAKFCDTGASLYKVPVDSSGNVPADFGAVANPMPIFTFNQKAFNYRARARAHFGSGKMDGVDLFAKGKAMAVQGEFKGLADETLTISKAGNDRTHVRSKFYPHVGGTTAGTVPSAVPTKWTQAGTRESGIFNQDIITRYRRSTNPGTLYAKERVMMDSQRKEGVTCLNGKYVYVRKMKDGSRPVVSTVREAFNRDGPIAANANWACRYVGVHCNANNCNNNGNTEIAGPFVEPKIRAKKEKPTPAPTPAPTRAPAPPPRPDTPDARRRSPRRRSRRKASRRRGSKRRRSKRKSSGGAKKGREVGEETRRRSGKARRRRRS